MLTADLNIFLLLCQRLSLVIPGKSWLKTDLALCEWTVQHIASPGYGGESLPPMPMVSLLHKVSTKYSLGRAYKIIRVDKADVLMTKKEQNQLPKTSHSQILNPISLI